jgi:predicted transcriptional regulator of viral defense system
MRFPKIYEHFERGQLFTIDEARTALNITGNTLRKRLCELAMRGYIRPVRQGLYQLTQPNVASYEGLTSPFALGSKVTPWCYVGFKTALQFYAHELPPEGDTIFVVSQRKFNPFEHNGRNYFWCQSPDDWGLESHTITEGQWQAPVLVSDFEKTLLDCIKRPMHSPPLHELIRLCRAAGRRPDTEKLFNYAAQTETAAIFNRLGFLLQTLEAHWDITAQDLQPFLQNKSRRQTEWHIETSLNAPVAPLQSALEESWHIQFPTLSLDKPKSDC